MKDQQRNAKVPANELTAMLIIFVSTNAFLTYPRYISSTGYEAAWMEPVFSGAMTLILFLLVEWILRTYFHNLDIVEVCKELFGRVGAAIIALIFAAYFLCSTAAVVREFTENVVSTVLPSTPILLVGATFMMAVGYIAYAGLEGICRTAFIFLPILLIGLIGVCLATMNWWHPSMLLPIWGAGLDSILVGSFHYSSIFANVLLLTIIYPHVYDVSKMRRIGFVSIAVSTLLLVGLMLTYHMVFPSVETGRASFALYKLARLIHLGPFFQRLESVFIFLWVTSATVRMAVSLWGASYLIGKAFGWPTYRPGIPALSLVALSMGMWSENWIQVINLDERYLMRWGWVIVFAMPVAILLIGMFVTQLRRGQRGPGGNRRRRGRAKHV